jgi:hypothetical protein
MNSEIREEVRRIQAELRKPFAPEVHGIRELPGRGYWAFIPHHQYRERLDEVYPEWEASYTHVEQITSDVICKCTITILGISKQAIGSVPLVAAEKNGRDVSRGSAADRLAAEAFKNACEAWGVGRYLDRQGEVAHYLNINATKLDNETRNKLKPFGNYLREKGELPSDNSNVSMPKLDGSTPSTIAPAKTGVISEGQIKRLWAIAKPLPAEVTRTIVKNIAGVDSNNDIPWAKYDAVIKAIESEIVARNTPAAPSIPNSLPPQPQANEPIPQPEIDRKMLMEEIDSLVKRKNISEESGKAILMELYGVKGRTQLSDKQLIDFRNYLSLQPSTAMAIAN